MGIPPAVCFAFCLSIHDHLLTIDSDYGGYLDHPLVLVYFMTARTHCAATQSSWICSPILQKIMRVVSCTLFRCAESLRYESIWLNLFGITVNKYILSYEVCPASFNPTDEYRVEEICIRGDRLEVVPTNTTQVACGSSCVYIPM